MSQQRGTHTHELASVIQVLQLGRKSGLLIAQRGEGTGWQEGKISFVKGHVIQAHCGVLEGQEALTALHAWGSCRFFFLPDGVERVTGPLPAVQVQTHAPEATQAHPVWRGEEMNTDSLPAPAAPRRAPQAEQKLSALERHGLTRQHRHLLLLIDGQRSPVELARLMGRSVDDIYTMLHDLAVFGLVYQ